MKYHNREQNVVMRFTAQQYGGSKPPVLSETKTGVPGTGTNFTKSVNVKNVAVSVRSSLSLAVDGEYFYSGNDGDYWSTFTSSGWKGQIYRVWFS